MLSVVAAQPVRCQPPQRQETPIDRWNRMSPEERERELAKLPPERARLIRQRIHRFNQMNEQEKQDLRDRYETFSQLPAEKQKVVRQRLSEFRQLPVARRPVVHGEVEQLRLLPEAQREARLNSDEFRSRFSPQEQQIIHDLTEYLQPPK
jgi:predicted Fe-S protein YdhL (DUF1289 family)